MHNTDTVLGRLDKTTDVQALRNLAVGWRDVSSRNRHDKDLVLRDDDPGPHITAIQLEWAAHEIEQLRAAHNTQDGGS